jgi:hypothetical protein
MKLILKFGSWLKSLFSKKTKKDQEVKKQIRSSRKNDPYIYD